MKHISIDFAFRFRIDTDQLAAFYDQYWNRKIALGIPEFCEWQFLQPPANKGKNHCVIAYDHIHQRIAGVMGLNCRNFRIANQSLRAAELTTWLVAPEYQGLGLGQQIIEKIQSEFDIALGMGITQQALPVYLKNGFRYLKNIPRFIKIFQWKKITPYAEINGGASKMHRLSLDKRPNCRYTLRHDSPLFEFPNIWHAARTAADTHWRYGNHPVFTYELFSVQSEHNTKAWVVIRQENSIPNLNIAHIVDFLAEDNQACRSALSFLEDYAKDKHIDLMDFYCTCASINKFFLSNGWFSAVDDDCFQFPHLFHPVELRKPATTSLIYWAKSGQIFEELNDFGKLYISKQDMDFDRPTAQNYFSKK